MKNEPKSALAKPEENSLVTALTGLSDGVVKLVKFHLELFREEAKRDAQEFGKAFGFVVAGAVVAIIGYLFVLASITFVVGAMYPKWGTALTAGILGSLHLLVGLWITFGSLQNIKKRRNLENTKHELERNNSWVKQLTDSSSKELELTSETQEHPMPK